MEFFNGFCIVVVCFKFLLDLIGDPYFSYGYTTLLVLCYCLYEMCFKRIPCFLWHNFFSIIHNLFEVHVLVELVNTLEDEHLVCGRLLYGHKDGSRILQCLEIHLHEVCRLTFHIHFLVLFEDLFISFFVITKTFLHVFDDLLRCFPHQLYFFYHIDLVRTSRVICTWSFVLILSGAWSFQCVTLVCRRRRSNWRILCRWMFPVCSWWRRWWCHPWLTIPHRIKWGRHVRMSLVLWHYMGSFQG